MKPKRGYKPGTIDDCDTPGYALEPIISWLESIGAHTVWEPAAGRMLLVNALRDHGFDVRASDIETGMDFLEYSYVPDIDVIVTNPPFSLKHEFVKKCMDIGLPWFLLMPMEAIATNRMLNKLEYIKGRDTNKVPNIGITIPTKRINFRMPYKGWNGNGSQFPTAWYSYQAFVGVEVFDASHWTKEYRQKFEI